jgi:large subunit ribosomal protein L17
MRHRKNTFKVGRTGSHRRCLLANMLKSLILEDRIHTTTTKAKELRRHADKLITLAKKNTLSSRREAIAKLMVRFNPLTSKENRAVKEGSTEPYNADRQVIKKLFDQLGPRFTTRQGGYTRIMKAGRRVGDNADTSVIEFLSE